MTAKCKRQISPKVNSLWTQQPLKMEESSSVKHISSRWAEDTTSKQEGLIVYWSSCFKEILPHTHVFPSRVPTTFNEPIWSEAEAKNPHAFSPPSILSCSQTLSLMSPAFFKKKKRKLVLEAKYQPCLHEEEPGDIYPSPRPEFSLPRIHCSLKCGLPHPPHTLIFSPYIWLSTSGEPVKTE